MTDSIFIAGCGYVGTALANALSKNGDDVWGLRRDPSGLPATIHPVPGDLLAPATLRPPPAETRYAVFCAGATHPTEGAYQDIYLRGLQNFLDLLARSPGLEHVTFLSSTSVYAQLDGSWVDENSPTEPTHFSGQTLLRAEKLLSEFPFETTTLRCSGIYGPTRTRLIDSVRNQTLRLPSAPHFTNRIHRDDIVHTIRHLLAMENPRPKKLLLVDSQPAPYNEVVNFLADQLGVPRPLVDPTAPPLRRGGHKRCSNRLLCNLGIKLRYPTYREGYADMLAGEQN